MIFSFSVHLNIYDDHWCGEQKDREARKKEVIKRKKDHNHFDVNWTFSEREHEFGV